MPSNPSDLRAVGLRMARYLVGCAGQFAQAADGAGSLHGQYDDVDEAFAACGDGPVGCEVFDTCTRQWIGPMFMEEIDAARAALATKRQEA